MNKIIKQAFRNKLPLYSLVSTYICLLIVFLLSTTLGLNAEGFHVWMKGTIGGYEIGFWQMVVTPETARDNMNFQLNANAIASMVFVGFALISFCIFLKNNKKKYHIFYVLISLLLSFCVFGLVLSSKSQFSNAIVCGWLYYTGDAGDMPSFKLSLVGWYVVGGASLAGLIIAIMIFLNIKTSFKANKPNKFKK